MTEDFPQGPNELQGIHTFNDPDAERAIEAAKRVVELEGRASKLVDASMKQDARNRELETKVQFDSLTGLYSRDGWLDSVHKAMEEATKTGDCLAIGFIDLDKFKVINDTSGHPAGDLALRRFGHKLQSLFRAPESNPKPDALGNEKYDHPENGISGRAGGDEFKVMAWLTPHAEGDAHLTPEERLTGIEKHVRSGIDEFRREFPKYAAIGLDASVGFAIWRPGDEIEETLRLADKAMYRDKHSKGQ